MGTLPLFSISGFVLVPCGRLCWFLRPFDCTLISHYYLLIASRLQRVSLIVIPFCLFVWMSVGHSATYSLPRLIDHNQIWSACPRTRVSLFGSPIFHTFGARGKNMQNFAYFQRHLFNSAFTLATCCHTSWATSCWTCCWTCIRHVFQWNRLH